MKLSQEFIPSVVVPHFPSPADSGTYVEPQHRFQFFSFSETLLYPSKYALLHSFGS